ncbi:peroxynitrite isomerase THAP4-like [Spea bombifrons]|uniref:peroxynitrite isomerase THAP4-like n=1 Tax=Spea bombifrons TaxID=233779 RepID=UPI002349BF6F|nr:peroxynitrite isomerase THAP4-like [Spea bombifrons]
MPMTCAAYGCNNHFSKGCGKQFFRFPMKDPERLSKWVAAMRRKNWKPSVSSRICSDHFTDKDYMLRPGAMIPRLRLDAVPSVFDGWSTHLKERVKRKKNTKKLKNEAVDASDMEILDKEQTKQNNDAHYRPPDDSAAPESLSSAVTIGVCTQDLQEEEQTGASDTGNEYCPEKKDVQLTCSVPGCSNQFFKTKGKRFFRFPMKDPERLSKWVAAMKTKNWNPSVSSRICSDHFTDKDYVPRPGAIIPRLHLAAVPSVFDGCSKHLKDHVTKKKITKKKKNAAPVEEANDTEIQDKDQSLPGQTDQREMSAPCRHSGDSTAAQDSSDAPAVSGTELQRKTEIRVKSQEINCFPENKRFSVMCAVKGCKNIFYKGSDKHFFRFPRNNPELCTKWVVAIHRRDWTPLVRSRICIDHFTCKDYTLQPGALTPQLHPHAVPSVFHVKSRSRNSILKAACEDPGPLKEKVHENKEVLRFADHTYSAAYHVIKNPTPCSISSTVILRKRIKTLQRRVQRQRHKIKNLSEIIEQLRNSNMDDNGTCQLTLSVVQ